MKPQRPRQPLQPVRPVARKPVATKSVSSGGSGGVSLPVIVGAVALAAGGWWYLQQKPTERPAAPEVTQTAPPAPAKPAEPSGKMPGLLDAVAPAQQGKPSGPALADMVTSGRRASGSAEAPRPADAPTGLLADAAAPKTEVEEERPRSERREMRTRTKEKPVAKFPEALVLDLVAGNKTEFVKAREEALREAFRTGRWDEYTALLQKSLGNTLQRLASEPKTEDYLPYFENPTFYQAFIQYSLLRALPEKARDFLTDDESNQGFYMWLLTNNEAAESLLISLTPTDKVDKVFQTWAQLWANDPKGRDKHRELALACALVYEEPRTFTWNSERMTVSAMDRYTFYKTHEEKNDLVGKIDRMPARDLVWVVCAQVPDSELEWALDKMHLRQKNWGEAYGMVKYDMEKAVKGTSKYDKYTFAEILKKGGICGDRAYFSANTARAAGIPACELSGDGPRGGHAWLAWMSDDGEWDTTGRFDGYAMGKGRHPQTGKSVSEQEFVWRSHGNAASTRSLTKASRLLWMSRLHEAMGDLPHGSAALALAIKADRYFPKAWEASLNFWLAHNREKPTAEWKDLVEGAKKDFREDADLAKLARKAEDEVIFPRQDAKTVMNDLRRDVRKMEREASKDGMQAEDKEIAATFRRQAETFKEKNDMEGIRSVYRQALRDMGNAATFKVLAKDFFDLVKADEAVAKKVAHDLETAWNRNIDKGGDYFDIQSQNSALAVVIDCFRSCGEADKAASLQHDYDLRKKKSTRNAL